MPEQLKTTQSTPTYYGLTGTLLWGLIIFILFSFLQFIVSLWFMQFTYGELNSTDRAVVSQLMEYNGTSLALSGIIPAFLCLVFIAALIYFLKKTNIKNYLGLHSFSVKQLGIWLAALALFILASDFLTHSLGKPIVPEVMLDIYRSAEPIWLLWIALMIGAPLFEEIFFRGFLLPGMQQSWLGLHGAVIVTSILWAIIHLQYDIYGIATIFLMGLLLGYAKINSGSLWLPILLHSLSNLTATIQTASLI